MSVLSARDLAKQQAHADAGNLDSNAGENPLKYIDQVSQATDWILTHPFESVTNAISAFAGLVTGNGQAAHDALGRLIGWSGQNQTGALKAWTQKQLQGVYQELFRLQLFTINLVERSERALFTQLSDLITAERKARIRGDIEDERYTRIRVAALNSFINHEAASAYRSGVNGRIAVITKLADFLASHNDFVSGLVRDLISGALDLLSVDDPLARLALGFIMRRIIDRLGADKLAGTALSDLLAPLLGDARPATLPAVIRDVSDRLGALESQWAQFYANGGSDVEQAGEEWAAITSPLTDVALLAFFGQAVADPAGWARELADVTEPVLGAAADAATALLREV